MRILLLCCCLATAWGVDPALLLDSLRGNAALPTELFLRHGRGALPEEDGLTGQPALRDLLRAGPVVLPLLLEHLADPRPLACPPIACPGLVVLNATDGRPPPDARREAITGTLYRPCLGDLCAVLLGRIGNRDYACLRRRASGAWELASPVFDPGVEAQIRATWAEPDEAGLRHHLAGDFLEPDDVARRLGAYRRLARRFPEDLPLLLLPWLATAPCAAAPIEALRRELLTLDDDAARHACIATFLDGRDRRWRRAVEDRLFADLDRPGAMGDHARRCLVAAFGHPETVRPADRPFPPVESAHDRLLALAGLTAEDSAAITGHLLGLLRQAEEPRLVLACLPRLASQGHAAECLAACRRLWPDAGSLQGHLGAAITVLEAALRAGTRPQAEDLPPLPR